MHAAMVKAHPEAYQKQADFRIDAKSLRDEIISPARTILLVLLAASGLVFIVACSNVANLILARSVRREGELAVRAALGAEHGRAAADAARREPAPLRRGRACWRSRSRGRWWPCWRSYAARFSVRAHDVTVDATCSGSAAGSPIAAAVLLAFVPRLPSADAANGMGLAGGGVRLTSGTNRRLRVFAVTQIARVVRARRRRRDAHHDALRAAAPADRLHAATCSR